MAGTLCGLALLGLFVAHALRSGRPLLELRHFAHRTFSAAATIQFLMGAVLIGLMLLLPLYYQLARGESAWSTGLLLVPQGAGAALTLWLTGRWVDRGHGKTVVLAGVPLLGLGVAAYTQAGPHTGYPVLVAALLVLGLGTGCLMAPVSAAAYSVLDRASIPRATSTLNIVQRIGGVLGTAAYAVVLQQNLAPAATPAEVVDAFAGTFWWPLAMAVLIAGPALLLPDQSNREEPNR
jgi:MFS family permease